MFFFLRMRLLGDLPVADHMLAECLITIARALVWPINMQSRLRLLEPAGTPEAAPGEAEAQLGLREVGSTAAPDHRGTSGSRLFAFACI